MCGFLLDFNLIIAATSVAFVAGAVKGTVGFGLPTVMISGLSLLMPVDQALASLIGSALITNSAQTLRQGWRAAWSTIIEHWRFITLVLVFMALSAQMVPLLSERTLYGMIGTIVLIFGITQLLGWQIRAAKRSAEWIFGTLTGLIGGVSGIWGPPTVIYLLSRDLDTSTIVRIQGVVFGLGSIMLAVAHIKSGVLNTQTLPLSLGLIVPSILGLSLGFWLQDRLDQQRFRQLTLMVLICAGVILLQRAFAS